MLYREIIAVCSEIHTKHINTVCGQNVILFNFKFSPGGIPSFSKWISYHNIYSALVGSARNTAHSTHITVCVNNTSKQIRAFVRARQIQCWEWLSDTGESVRQCWQWYSDTGQSVRQFCCTETHKTQQCVTSEDSTLLEAARSVSEHNTNTIHGAEPFLRSWQCLRQSRNSHYFIGPPAAPLLRYNPATVFQPIPLRYFLILYPHLRIGFPNYMLYIYIT